MQLGKVFRNKIRAFIFVTALGVLFPNVSFADGLSGDWRGKGSCFLSHAGNIASTCDFTVSIALEPSHLSLKVCTTWYQEWGTGRGCTHRNFEIRNQSELWYSDLYRTFEAGFLSGHELVLHFDYLGGSISERYLRDSEKLKFSSSDTSTGMVTTLEGILVRDFLEN